MSYQTDREDTIARLARAGWPTHSIRTVLRLAHTAQRLAVAQCNGDYPADNGERPTRECHRCARLWAPESFKRDLCPDCRNDDAITAALPDGWQMHTAGDPRGYVVKVAPSYVDRQDMDHGNDPAVVYVPAKEGR